MKQEEAHLRGHSGITATPSPQIFYLIIINNKKTHSARLFWITRHQRSMKERKTITDDALLCSVAYISGRTSKVCRKTSSLSKQGNILYKVTPRTGGIVYIGKPNKAIYKKLRPVHFASRPLDVLHHHTTKL